MYLDQNHIFWDPHYLKNTEDTIGCVKCYSEPLCKCLRQLPYFWWKHSFRSCWSPILPLGIASPGSLIIRRKWDVCAKEALILCKYIYIEQDFLLWTLGHHKEIERPWWLDANRKCTLTLTASSGGKRKASWKLVVGFTHSSLWKHILLK